MPTVGTAFRDELEARAGVIRETFGVPAGEDLVSGPLQGLDVGDDVIRRLGAFNIEWHIIPSTALVPFDDAYLARMYARGRATSTRPLPGAQRPPDADGVTSAGPGDDRRRRNDAKPTTSRRLPAVLRRRCGLDPTCDPLRGYIENAGLKSGPRFINSRFSHTPGSLRTLGAAISADWTERGLIPAGYQLFVCPPTVFNLVGVLFHREWSDTPTLELSAYTDERGNGFGLAVGSNEPGDFSHARRLETDPDLRLLGFRMALVAANVAMGSTESGKSSQ
jgi:hypothetical protein